MTKHFLQKGIQASAIALGLSIFISPSYADVGDFYIRSSKDTGKFTGSHEISAVPIKGFYKTSFCNQNFWMRGSTVAWSEGEVSAGRKLLIMQETADGRRTLCSNAGEYVAANAAKLPKSIRRANVTGPKRSRLNVISEAFKDFK